ncbi:Creatinase/aminopeptidase [Lentinula aff. detonsa]|nr:Creatinase/aminopeptidase [Lentinula aff. detonsa]
MDFSAFEMEVDATDMWWYGYKLLLLCTRCIHALATFPELLKLLPISEKAKPQILLLSGEVTPFRNDTDRAQVFRQELNFFYLSGCTVPSSYLLIAFQDGTGLSQKPSIELFIPKAELADMMWSVPPLSLEAASQTHDVNKIDRPAATLLKAFPNALFHTIPRGSPLLSFHQSPPDLFLLPALCQARSIKNEHEISLIRKANEISSRAHEVVMRVLGKAVKGGIERGPGTGVDRPLLPGEWLIEKEADARAIFVASCRREGYTCHNRSNYEFLHNAVHQVYLPIVAANTRALTLHYCCNNRELAWGPLSPRVLLIDAGTMPVGNSGKFTSEARAIYELLLEMQKKILPSGISPAFFPHVEGQSLGMDVHDTMEAGCYFSPHLISPVRDSKHINKEVLERYESVGGVQIEDVVLITEDGYNNLTTEVHSDTECVEGVCLGAL